MSGLAAMIFILPPLTLICGGIFALASALRHRPMARTLRISAAAWFASLGALYAAIIVAVEPVAVTCSMAIKTAQFCPKDLPTSACPPFFWPLRQARFTA